MKNTQSMNIKKTVRLAIILIAFILIVNVLFIPVNVQYPSIKNYNVFSRNWQEITRNAGVGTNFLTGIKESNRQFMSGIWEEDWKKYVQFLNAHKKRILIEILEDFNYTKYQSVLWIIISENMGENFIDAKKRFWYLYEKCNQ